MLVTFLHNCVYSFTIIGKLRSARFDNRHRLKKPVGEHYGDSIVTEEIPATNTVILTNFCAIFVTRSASLLGCDAEPVWFRGQEVLSISRPRIVLVLEAKRSASMPKCWRM